MTPVYAATASGRLVDLMAPQFETKHLYSEIAHGLANLARFAGQTDVAYSVAQHSLLMAEAAEDETGDAELAAFCLLHEGHEAVLGDKTSPRKRAEAETLRRMLKRSGAPQEVAQAWIARTSLVSARAEEPIDAAIWQAAGLSRAAADRHAAAVRLYDLRALLTEKRDLFAGSPPWPDMPDGLRPLPLRARTIQPLPPGRAYERFAAALTRLAPATAAWRCRDGDAA